MIKKEKLKMEVILAKNVNIARFVKPTIAIEAEWGSYFAEGSRITMNHHGQNSKNPAPCVTPVEESIAMNSDDVIVISHIDLDTIGGMMQCLNLCSVKLKKNKKFWELAAFIDINGAHKINEFEGLTEDLERKINSYWAFFQKPENLAPRFSDDDTYFDVTELVFKHIIAIIQIIQDDEELLAQGDEFKKNTEELNNSTFVEIKNGVIFRIVNSEDFVNHLYTTPKGEIGEAVVSFNNVLKSITISTADEIDGFDCCRFLQKILGLAAGGRTNIAGGDRNFKYSVETAEEIFEKFCAEINKKN
jgi:hypothetical protein